MFCGVGALSDSRSRGRGFESRPGTRRKNSGHVSHTYTNPRLLYLLTSGPKELFFDYKLAISINVNSFCWETRNVYSFGLERLGLETVSRRFLERLGLVSGLEKYGMSW